MSPPIAHAPSRSPLRRAGFSLVEALVALTMLSIGVLAMGGALSATNRAARDSLDATVAEHLVRQKLQALRHVPPSEVRGGAETVELDGISFTRRWRIQRGVPRPGMTRIEVDVEWSEYAAPLVQPLSQPVTRTLTDPLGTAEGLLESSGRTRMRSMTGYRAN